MTQPLLIGGATTSRVHTAVKIAPNYAGTTVYVPDASRAVGVASNLLSDGLSGAYVAEVAADYDRIRRQHAGRKGPALISLAAARANAFRTDWAHYAPPVPMALGRREFRNVDLAELAKLIDWGPFFQTWELSGAVSGHPRRSRRRRGGARRARRGPGDAEADRRRPLARGERRRRACSPRIPSATTSSSTPTKHAAARC